MNFKAITVEECEQLYFFKGFIYCIKSKYKCTIH